MADVVRTVKAPLSGFYDSLTATQSQRFDALRREFATGGLRARTASGNGLAALYTGAGPEDRGDDPSHSATAGCLRSAENGVVQGGGRVTVVLPSANADEDGRSARQRRCTARSHAIRG
jgi:hypothetical protein